MTTSSTEKPNWFAASRVAQLLNSDLGRVTRVGGGVALITAGVLLIGGPAGFIVAAIGMVPLLAGVLDVCVFSALFRGPLRGDDVRACARQPD